MLGAGAVDAALITNPVNVTYLTGFTGDSSYLVVLPARVILVSDGRFVVQLAEECPGLETHIRPPSQSITEAASAVLGRIGLRTVLLESGHMTVADYELLRSKTTLDWKPVAGRVEQMRMIKDDAEVAEIRHAIRIAEKAFTMFRAMLRPDDREKDMADAMEMFVRKAGGSGCAFPPIVAVGERAALPHAPPTERSLEDEDLVLVDWGATGRLYKSDLTRVLLTHPQAMASRRPGSTTTLADVHRVVLDAQQQAIALLRPGVKALEVDAQAREFIAAAGFGDHFNHGLGHGFGLQIHEAPFLKPGHDIVLKAGMVVTVEPGIYIEGWAGIRIEDDVLITADGHEVLTSVPRDIEASVLNF